MVGFVLIDVVVDGCVVWTLVDAVECVIPEEINRNLHIKLNKF